MAITQVLTDTFKQDCLDGAQNLGSGGNTLKIALYTSSASSIFCLVSPSIGYNTSSCVGR